MSFKNYFSPLFWWYRREIYGFFSPINEQLALLGLEQNQLFAWRNAALLTDLPWRSMLTS